MAWQFGKDERRAFERLKASFTGALILCHWMPDLPMTVETDVLDHAIAAILLVTTLNAEIQPVAFHSRSLHDTKKNYDIHDKELLAIFEAYKIWRHYLEGSGRPIDTVTDHKNLEYFTSMKKLTQRQARWSEYLSQFNLKIRFRPGRLGMKPDALTRCWDVLPGGGDAATPTNVRPIFTEGQLTGQAARANEGTTLMRTWNPWAIIAEIAERSINDPFAKHMREELRANPPPEHWELHDNLLYFRGRTYVPNNDTLQLQIIRNHHDHPASGHFGQQRTTALVRREFHWPGLGSMVKWYVKTCRNCGRAKTPRHKPYGLLKQLPIPV